MLNIRVGNLPAVSSSLKLELKKFVDEVAEAVKQEAINNTPKKTGYARSQWRKNVGASSFDVENRAPYIERLDKGSSKQAPNGIVMPTIRNVQRRYGK